jgi:hypothetical protein
MTIKPDTISLIRLESQHLGGKDLPSPKAIVAWMGAMQAQDFPMAKWATGVRLPGSTETLIEAAINKGEVLRTHVLRPTWHFVTSEDIVWLIDLTAPQIKAGQSSRDRELELTPDVYRKSNSLIEKALSSQGPLSREALVAILNSAGIATDQNRAAHLFSQAELDKIICSGPILRGKPTYALLAERVAKPTILVKEEALYELARRYFTSRGPATLQDFTWWSGLTARNARQALELVKPEFTSDLIDDHTYWFTDRGQSPPSNELSVHLLPSYDEFIISYSNRSHAIPASLEQHMKQISDRGVFRPVIVINGRVAGVWKRTITKNIITIEIEPFSELSSVMIEQIEAAAFQFAVFCGKQLVFSPSIYQA